MNITVYFPPPSGMKNLLRGPGNADDGAKAMFLYLFDRDSSGDTKYKPLKAKKCS